MRTLRELVQSALDRNGLKQKFVAERMQMPYYHLSRILRRVPDADETLKLKAILCAQMKLIEEDDLLASIETTKRINKEQRDSLKLALMEQVRLDAAREMRRKNKSNKMNSENSMRCAK